MIIIEAERHGAPDVLVPRDKPDLSAGPGEALVELAWSGVLALDTLIRRGVMPAQFAVDFPWTPGQGGAGVVTAVGAGVSESWLGRRVAVDATGSYAQQVVVVPDRLLPVPDTVGLDQAIGLLLDGGTALGLWETALASEPVGAVAVTPVAGGAGTVLVQLAHEAGHRVVGLAGGERKAELARALGADVVIDHRHDDWPDLLRAERPGVLFDGIGGPDAATRAAALARPGSTSTTATPAVTSPVSTLPQGSASSTARSWGGCPRGDAPANTRCSSVLQLVGYMPTSAPRFPWLTLRQHIVHSPIVQWWARRYSTAGPPRGEPRGADSR